MSKKLRDSCRIIVASAAVMACTISTAQAMPTTFELQGTVTGYRTDLAVDPFGGAIGAGAMIRGYYTFDSTAHDSDSGTGIGNYYWSGIPYTVHAEINGYAFDYGQGLYITVTDNCGSGAIDPTTGCGNYNPHDLYHVLSGETSHSGSSHLVNSFHLFLVDSSLSAINDDSLLVAPPSLTHFTRADGTLFSQERSLFDPDVDRYWIDYDLTALSLRTVPEPASLALVSLGLACLGFLRRRTA